MSEQDTYILHGHAKFIGPCVHGRDPWTRCDECGEGDAVDALLKRLDAADEEVAGTVLDRERETARANAAEERARRAEQALSDRTAAETTADALARIASELDAIEARERAAHPKTPGEGDDAVTFIWSAASRVRHALRGYRAAPPRAAMTATDDLRVLREMAAAPPVEGRDFTRMAAGNSKETP